MFPALESPRLKNAGTSAAVPEMVPMLCACGKYGTALS